MANEKLFKLRLAMHWTNSHSNFNSAKQWVIKQQIDDVVNEEGDDLDYDYRAVNGMDIEELIYEYVSKFNDIKNKDEIQIYRLIRLDNIKQLELNHIGEYWSFEESGVGDYGSGRREFKGNKSFVLTGLVNPINLWEGGKFKSNILEYKKDYDGLHPTQKPILLLEDLVKTFSNENDLVVDLTMGSGSTAIACMNTNRNFIGIEKDFNYFDVSKKRVEKKRKEKDL